MMHLKRNEWGGLIAPAPGGYQRDNARTFGVGVGEKLWLRGSTTIPTATLGRSDGHYSQWAITPQRGLKA